jgi:WbqC-like protein family
MVLGIMQPYFFPYLGYFDLINRCDEWIVFDTSQYIRHGWMNRNRILHPQAGWHYIVVPVKKHKHGTPINQIEIVPPASWRPHILRHLMHYKKRAPFFRETLQLVEECLTTETTSLVVLNTRILGLVSAHLGIRWQHEIFSTMHLDLGDIKTASDLAVRMAVALGAEEYINRPGGANQFDRAKFEACGIKLTIQPSFEFTYATPGYTFEPDLSVIDALMWNSPEVIKAHLDAQRTQ